MRRMGFVHVVYNTSNFDALNISPQFTISIRLHRYISDEFTENIL